MALLMGALGEQYWPNARFYMSGYFYGVGIARLVGATGGNIETGAGLSYAGIPITLSPRMPGAGDQTGKCMILFGDMSARRRDGRWPRIAVRRMKRGISTGTPLIADTWIGATVACIGDVVLAVELGADPLVTASWRTYARAEVMQSRGLAYVCRDDNDRARIAASWHRKCGAMTPCQCGNLDNIQVLPSPRPSSAPRAPAPTDGRRGG